MASKDVPAIRSMVADWHARGGVVSTIDVSLRLHEEHERKLHRWLYGDELKEVSPLPDFYKQLQDSFNDISMLRLAGLGVAIIPSFAHSPRKDSRLRIRDVSHLFEASVASVLLKRDSHQPDYVYRFLHLVDASLERRRVEGLIFGS